MTELNQCMCKVIVPSLLFQKEAIPKHLAINCSCPPSIQGKKTGENSCIE